MSPGEILEHLTLLAERLGVQVKTGRYDGKGGMARVRDTWILLVDRSMPEASRVDLFVDELCRLDYEGQYLPPVIREKLDRAARKRNKRSVG